MQKDLNIRTVLSREVLPATGSGQVVFALVGLRAGGDPTGRSLPANFSLVLDRSGSMDGAKLDRLKEAVGAVVDRLGESDRLSVVIFDDTVETLVPSQPVRDRDAIKRTIGAVIARGGTQISDGLRAGMDELRKGLAPDRVNRVLLLTDGMTWDDEQACLDLADAAAREGIAITSIGIGTDWNEKLLLQIAERSRGNSHWIENPDAIPAAFRTEVDGMRAVALTNLRVAVRTSPGVELARVYRTVPMIADLIGGNGRETALELGSLDGSRGQTLLLDLRVPARPSGPFLLGTIEATCDVPSRGETGLRVSAELTATISADGVVSARVNAEVMNLAEKVSAFKLQTRALTDIAAGNVEAATRRLQSAATVLLDLGEPDLAAEVSREARTLSKTGALTAAGTKKLEYGTRNLTQNLTTTLGK